MSVILGMRTSNSAKTVRASLENHCLHEYIYKGNNTKIDINDIQPSKEKPLLMSGFSFDLLGLREFEATRK